MPKFEYDFLDIHNDDLIPVDSYEGVVIYVIDYDKALERQNAFIRQMIERRKERSESVTQVVEAAS